VARRACAFFSPCLDPVLDRGKGHTHAVVSPQRPAGRPVGHAVLNHQPYRQIDHTRGGVPARRCQIGQVRLKVLATLGAVMLRIGDHKMTRTRQGEVAQVVPCPRRLLVPIRRMPTMRTHVPSVVATLGNHLWLGQGGNRGDPFGGIGSRRTRTEHCCGLLAHRFGPTLYDNGPSAAIPKPGIFAIVSPIPSDARLLSCWSCFCSEV
jgi:hypothetical protein